MFKATVLAALVAATGIAQAQTAASSPAKTELIARLLKLQQPAIENFARTLTEQPAMQVMQRTGPVLQNLPAERREAVARDVEADLRKYVEETAPIVRERAVKLAPSTIGTLLEERFTEDELRQIVTMLESPANKKFLAASPDMQRALGEKLVAESRPEVEVKLQALQVSVAKRLALAPAAAGASKAGVAPKAAAATASGAKK